MTRVIHLTSAHQRRDIRIFLKECCSLAAAGYDTHLVVADGLGDALVSGVHIKDTGSKSGGRLSRMALSAFKVYSAGLALDGDIYHLHDPELWLWALALKAKGKKVIFDAHEDLPAQILTKPYIQPYLRKLIAGLTDKVERFVARKIDAVVGATPSISHKFAAIGVRRTVDINNFPLEGELVSADRAAEGSRAVCYVGGISAIRGIAELVEAMALTRTDARIILAGSFGPASLRADMVAKPGWNAVDEVGQVNRDAVREILGKSIAGLVTYLPAPNHVHAQPNKMFEYMSAGVPVIASDFPLWREIVEGNDCGLLVDPHNPKAIAEAIDTLVSSPEMTRCMGENGRRAVKEKYNWAIEEAKLIALYKDIVGPPQLAFQA
ncbi:MAG: glycosyltransferase family 4 protein [Rhizobiaceae bacterium]|nr:glycosyltransferase family 4 protein [Rhizobiaceae bacterium]